MTKDENFEPLNILEGHLRTLGALFNQNVAYEEIQDCLKEAAIHLSGAKAVFKTMKNQKFPDNQVKAYEVCLKDAREQFKCFQDALKIS